MLDHSWFIDYRLELINWPTTDDLVSCVLRNSARPAASKDDEHLPSFTPLLRMLYYERTVYLCNRWHHLHENCVLLFTQESHVLNTTQSAINKRGSLFFIIHFIPGALKAAIVSQLRFNYVLLHFWADSLRNTCLSRWKCWKYVCVRMEWLNYVTACTLYILYYAIL